MLLSELADYLEAEFTYPVELDEVVERAGDVPIGEAGAEDPETIGSALDSLGPDSFDSADALFKTIYGNVGDDRGGNPSEVPGAPSDEEHVSFYSGRRDGGLCVAEPRWRLTGPHAVARALRPRCSPSRLSVRPGSR